MVAVLPMQGLEFLESTSLFVQTVSQGTNLCLQLFENLILQAGIIQ